MRAGVWMPISPDRMPWTSQTPWLMPARSSGRPSAEEAMGRSVLRQRDWGHSLAQA